MSNPLAAFRKYQKVMLAIAAVGAMLAFGVLPILSDFMNQSRGGGGPSVDGNAVAVSWDGGKLSEAELQGRRVLRSQLMAFQRGVVERTLQRGAQPRVVVVPNTNAEASIVESLLLAKEAERMGIQIGDAAVLNHLTQHLANDTIDRNELAAILQATTGGRLSQAQLFEGMKTELAAHQVRILANGAAFDGGVTDTSLTPSQSFDYFKRLYRRMEAEIIAVPAADFVDQVTTEPTESEIAESYGEYKEVFPSPITPTPGFKEPMRVAFHWVKADFPTFLEKEIESLTDEEIQKYYDDNKSSYQKISLPSTDDLDTLNDPEDETALDDPDTDDLLLNDDPEANEETPAEGDDTASDGPSTDEGNDSDASEGGDEIDVASPQEQESDAQDAVATSETGNDVTAESSESADADEEEAVEYQPLEEVRDDIAQTLARPKASEAITQAVNEVLGEVNDYFDDYMFWDTTPEEEKGVQPTPPDVKALAERLGLVSGEIPLISALDAEDYELGRAFELDFSTGQIRRLPFTMLGFSQSLARYKPQKISASDVDSQFVFWKVDDKEAYTPSLEEARPAIVRHWKMKKALELAKAEGEKLAQAVRNQNQSLKTAFGEDESKTVTETGQFTWMTFGATPTGQGPPRLSFVEGVDYPGQEFMEDVSRLESGEVTVTQNYPETIAYVVYVKAVTANQEDLQTLFLNEGVKQPVLFMARQDNMRTATDWYLAKEKNWGTKWERPAASSTVR